jgi:hypothetical protein
MVRSDFDMPSEVIDPWSLRGRREAADALTSPEFGRRR